MSVLFNSVSPALIFVLDIESMFDKQVNIQVHPAG